jgi:hypothetical protein
VVNYEVVLASGDMKDGNNNFGIVTRFDMQSFPQGQMWGGLLTYGGSTFPELAEKFINFTNSPEADPEAHVIAASSFAFGQEFAVSSIYHSKPEAKPSSLAPFAGIQPQVASSLRTDSLLGFADEVSAVQTSNVRSLFHTTTWKADLSMMKEVRALTAATVASLSDVTDLVLALAFQPLTKDLLAASAVTGGNSMGLSPSEGPLVITMLQSIHANASDDEKVRKAMQSLIASIENTAKKRSKFHKYKFMNYSYKTQDPISGYDFENIARLRAVSRKYDPKAFFQDLVPGGYKIPGL